MKKLILVSIVIRGKQYSAFVWMIGNTLTLETLHDIFPVMNSLYIGETFSFG